MGTSGRRWRGVRRVAGGLFLVNMAISGEWNFQGGARSTFVWEFPFQKPDVDVRCRPADGAATSRLPASSWIGAYSGRALSHNLGYCFVGRYSGMLSLITSRRSSHSMAFLSAPRRRPGWQWLVLGAAIAQMLFFIIGPAIHVDRWRRLGREQVPHGGVRHFPVPAPAVRRAPATAVLPWAVGALFTAQLVLNPFPRRSIRATGEARAAALVAG